MTQTWSVKFCTGNTTYCLLKLLKTSLSCLLKLFCCYRWATETLWGRFSPFSCGMYQALSGEFVRQLPRVCVFASVWWERGHSSGAEPVVTHALLLSTALWRVDALLHPGSIFRSSKNTKSPEYCECINKSIGSLSFLNLLLLFASWLVKSNTYNLLDINQDISRWTNRQINNHICMRFAEFVTSKLCMMNCGLVLYSDLYGRLYECILWHTSCRLCHRSRSSVFWGWGRWWVIVRREQTVK